MIHIQELFIAACVCRARWLTCPDPDAEELFRMVGEVFIFWSKSHVSLLFSDIFIYVCIYSVSRLASLLCYILQNFKREEQNFVVMNEINNMSFLTADSKSKMSKVLSESKGNVKVKHCLFSSCLIHLLPYLES